MNSNDIENLQYLLVRTLESEDYRINEDVGWEIVDILEAMSERLDDEENNKI